MSAFPGVEENPAVLIINRIRRRSSTSYLFHALPPVVVVAKRRFLINVLIYTLALFPPVIAVTDALIRGHECRLAKTGTKESVKSWREIAILEELNLHFASGTQVLHDRR